MAEVTNHCDPLCPFAACDDCPHQGERVELDRQMDIYDALEDAE